VADAECDSARTQRHVRQVGRAQGMIPASKAPSPGTFPGNGPRRGITFPRPCLAAVRRVGTSSPPCSVRCRRECRAVLRAQPGFHALLPEISDNIERLSLGRLSDHVRMSTELYGFKSFHVAPNRFALVTGPWGQTVEVSNF
jgi:hypothetical protein